MPYCHSYIAIVAAEDAKPDILEAAKKGNLCSRYKAAVLSGNFVTGGCAGIDRRLCTLATQGLGQDNNRVWG